MHIKIERDSNGKYRRCWSGVYSIGGKRDEVSLNKWEGEWQWQQHGLWIIILFFSLENYHIYCQ